MFFFLKKGQTGKYLQYESNSISYLWIKCVSLCAYTRSNNKRQREWYPFTLNEWCSRECSGRQWADISVTCQQEKAELSSTLCKWAGMQSSNGLLCCIDRWAHHLFFHCKTAFDFSSYHTGPINFKMKEKLVIVAFPEEYNVSLYIYRDISKKNKTWREASEVIGISRKKDITLDTL